MTVTKFDGYGDNLHVAIHEKAAHGDHDKCTGCGLCATKYPMNKIPGEWSGGKESLFAIYKPFEQTIRAASHSPPIS